VSKIAIDSSAGYHYQTAVTLFQAISMTCNSEELLSFWSGPTWSKIMEEGADDVNMQSEEGDHYMMQVKYKISDSISLAAETSDYFKHMIYHLRLAVRTEEKYLNKQVKVEYWSFATPSKEIANWQAELQKNKQLGDETTKVMKILLEKMLERTSVVKAVNANEITQIKTFLNDPTCLNLFLTSHYIRISILWDTLMTESLNLLKTFISKEFPAIADDQTQLETLSQDLYYKLHSILSQRNVKSSTTEMSRLPLSERQKQQIEKKQTERFALLSSKRSKQFHAKYVKDLQKLCKIYNVAVSGKKDDIIFRLLDHEQKLGIVKSEIKEQKFEKARKSAEKRMVFKTDIEGCIRERIQKYQNYKDQSDFKTEIVKHVEIYREWRKRTTETSPANWYVESVKEALPLLEAIANDGKLPVESQARLLAGWFSRLNIVYGKVPSSDRDERHAREREQRMKRKSIAMGVITDLNDIHRDPALHTDVKNKEIKRHIEFLADSKNEGKKEQIDSSLNEPIQSLSKSTL
jgi:hypothetical protein